MALVAPPQLDDQSLRAAQLSIEKPLALPGLSLNRPPPGTVLEIIGEYHLPNHEEPMRCSHCPQHQNHRNSFAISDKINAYLLGSSCGPEHYGLSFNMAMNQYKALTKRKGLLERLSRICGIADDIRAACHKILFYDQLQVIDSKRKQLKSASANAFFRLSSSVYNSSPLTETVQVRDYEAEQRRDERRQNGEQQSPLYKHETRYLGLISGGELLRERGDIREILVTLQNTIREAEKISGQTDDVDISTLSKVVRKVEDTHLAAQNSTKDAETAHLFFSDANLGRLEAWSRSYTDFELARDGSSLIVDDRATGQRSIAPIVEQTIGRLPNI